MLISSWSKQIHLRDLVALEYKDAAFARLIEYPNGGEANMTMIATVNPYNSTNNNNHFKITDVTDEYEEEKHEKYLDQEGSLIEYCRLDHRENAKNQPNICVPSVVKCLSNRSTFVPADNFAQTNNSGTLRSNVSMTFAPLSVHVNMWRNGADDRQIPSLFFQKCLRVSPLLYQFTGMVLTINLGVTDGVDHWLGERVIRIDKDVTMGDYACFIDGGTTQKGRTKSDNVSELMRKKADAWRIASKLSSVSLRMLGLVLCVTQDVVWDTPSHSCAPEITTLHGKLYVDIVALILNQYCSLGFGCYALGNARYFQCAILEHLHSLSVISKLCEHFDSLHY
uniref:Ig-like domain-containing protein n=1 Tax=Ascaris lumbricoides TaxID=6252 RepID=A0A0M3HPJ7_ASCLU